MVDKLTAGTGCSTFVPFDQPTGYGNKRHSFVSNKRRSLASHSRNCGYTGKRMVVVSTIAIRSTHSHAIHPQPQLRHLS